jgi:hypothetical protein
LRAHSMHGPVAIRTFHAGVARPHSAPVRPLDWVTHRRLAMHSTRSSVRVIIRRPARAGTAGTISVTLWTLDRPWSATRALPAHRARTC